jgi:transcriptional regulator with GAF, ATPase, and Fis domain
MGPTGTRLSPTDAQSLASVLSEIAETASETLELREVFDRIATAVRRVIPLDHMGVVRIHNEHAVEHASTYESCYLAVWEAEGNGAKALPAEGCGTMQPCPLTNWSPRLRPRSGPIPRIDDAVAELDSSFPGDAEILGAGVRSTLWEPFRLAEPFSGGVWLSAYRPNAFTDEHQELLRPIAALLGSAVEHWRIWDTERRRRERLDKVDALLGTLAQSLDVREVFERLSTEMKALLPHDMMALTELDTQARTIELIALAGGCDIPPPQGPVPLTDEELERRLDYEIIHDIQARIAPVTERQRLLAHSGLRSWVRVPVWLAGEVSGGLSFFHREPSRFDREDAEVARRLADRIALMLSHHRLAEEARIAAEARERADRLAATVDTLTHELEAREQRPVVGVSASWKETMRAVGRVAGSETTVLVTGESGTGKEVVAKLLHHGSPRADKPFVAINCAALPEQLLESELFGHEKGAFTGAVATKIGRIEQAAGGTLFLDEIGEMSPQVQAKFLRVLEQREFQRVGGTRTLKADVRVIAATNRDLAAAIGRHTFREDLFYRLNVFQIHIAPLRRRSEDILPLAEAFLEDLGRTMGRPAAGISRDAREWMLTYPWPGNVRELRNAIERAILLCDGGLITHDHLPVPLAEFEPPRTSNGHGELAGLPADEMDLEVVERAFVEKALGQARGNKSKAARLLGLTRAQLYFRLEKYGFTDAAVRSPQ